MHEPEGRGTAPIGRGLWLLLIGLLIGLGTASGFRLLRWTSALGTSHTRIEQSAVVDRLQSVAKLVTTEAMMRDVVVYQNTYLGSTKRSLVVVTGKALVGIDVSKPPRIDVDQSRRRIAIALPHARLIGIDILELKTYDESRGLWNPFHPADRDTIYQLARDQLAATSHELAVIQHAEDGARKVLTSLFAAEGYEVVVGFGN